MSLRVVQVITGLEVGGAERLLHSTLRHLPRDQFDLTVVCLSGEGSIGREIEALGIPVINLGTRSLTDIGGALRLRKVLKDLKPQILHTHLFRANLWGRLMGWSLRIPVIVASEHSLTRTHFEGRPHAAWLTWIDTMLSRLSDAVIAVSESTRDLLLQNGVAPAKVFCILNAIDTALYVGVDGTPVRREFGLEASTVISVVGRLVPQKNHRLLLDAFPEVLRSIPDAVLLVVGSGSLKPELEQQAAYLPPGSVRFLNTRSDIPAIMAASDVVVMPSSYEPFGIAIIEAMASSRPVVGTSVDGIPELIDNGVTGFLVPPDDPAALSSAIISVLQDKALAASMGRAGSQRVVKFDIRTSAALLQDLYRRLYAAYLLRHGDQTSAAPESSIL